MTSFKDKTIIAGVRSQLVRLSGGPLHLRENDICFKYSDNVDALKKLMEEVRVSTEITAVDKYFEYDKEPRVILWVFVERKNKIKFKFGMSLNDTYILTTHTADEVNLIPTELAKKQAEIQAHLLYSLLSTMGSEFYCPTPFEEFCGECGFDTDSRRAERTYHRCLELSADLHQIFTEKEVACLPR